MNRVTQALIIFFLLCSSVTTQAELTSFFEERSRLSSGAKELFAYLTLMEGSAEGLLFSSPALQDDMKDKLMLVTSAANHCLGCVCWAIQNLKKANISEKEILELQSEFQSLKLPDKDKALLTVARELTLHPATAAKYVEDAKKIGWSDHELAITVLIVSHFNARNRMRNGFNLGPDKEHPYKPDQKLPMASCP